MKPKYSRSFLSLVGGSLLVLATPASAITYYWDNDGTTAGFGTASGSWADPTANLWSTSAAGTGTPGASITTQTTDTVNFGNGATGLGAGTINVGTVSTGAMTFAEGSGAITLSGGTITQIAAQTITVRNSSNTISSILAGAATSLTKAGTGSLTMSGANTYTGATILSGGGTLVLDYTTQNNSKLADTLGLSTTNGSGNIIIRGGSHTELVGTLSVGGTFVIPGGGSVLYAGHTIISREAGSTAAISGAITRNARSGATLSLAGDGSVTTTSAAGNGILTGGITVGSNWATTSATLNGDGTRDIVAFAAYTALTVSNTSATTNYNLAGDVTRTAALAANSLRIEGSGGADQILDLGASRNISVGSLNIGSLGNGASGGILYAGGGTGNYTITGSGTSRIQAANGNQEVIFTIFSGTLNIDIPVMSAASTTGPLTKTGLGTLVLKSAGDYAGPTFINQGVLRMANATATGTAAYGIIVGNGAALELSTGIVVGAEALNITGTGVSNTGALANFSGANTYGGAITIGTGGARINANAGSLALIGGVVTSLNNNVTFGGAVNTTVSTTAISGAGGLTKDGNGTLTLDAGVTHSYTGATNVSAGTLVVNANISTSLLTTVQTGATIGGTGTVAALTVDNGGFIAPGNSPGIMNTGNYNQAGTYLVEIAGTTAGNLSNNHDQINVAGTVNLSGVLSLGLLGAYTPTANDLYFIIANDSPGGIDDAVVGTFSNATDTTRTTVYTFDGQQFRISYTANNTGPGTGTFTGGNDVALMAVVVPEPNTMLLGAIGVLALLRRRR